MKLIAFCQSGGPKKGIQTHIRGAIICYNRTPTKQQQLASYYLCLAINMVTRAPHHTNKLVQIWI